jgi:dipeptidyl aminopeptidase/acylaminoacyl peptidase
MPAAGGDATQITTTGGTMPFESLDGKAIFYHLWQDDSGIWSVPVGGGAPIRVTEPTHHYPVGFTVMAEGLYYPAPPHSGDQYFIRFFSFSTRRTSSVVEADHRYYLGFSVSPDSRYILFDKYDERGSDLMLVKNFQPR